MKSNKKTIEEVFKKNTYDKYYDLWIKNFSINLSNIWKEHSVSELKLSLNNSSSALVIGRGPSITNNDHFNLLLNSN